MNPRALRHALRHPAQFVRFQATGKLPRGTRPGSPLIDLLESLTPRERAGIHGLKVDARLGYAGSRFFHSAEQALRWLKPHDEMFESWPAESWRDKQFRKALTIDDLAACAARLPESLRARLAAPDDQAPAAGSEHDRPRGG